MVKKDFCRYLAKNENMTQILANQLVDVFCKNLINFVADTGNCKLNGFGRFDVDVRRARRTHIPQQGKQETLDVIISDKRKIKFTPYCEFIKAVDDTHKILNSEKEVF